MKCHARTKAGTRCKHDAWEGWPMCKQHIQAAYKELLHAGGLKTMTFGVVENEPLFYIGLE